MKKRGSVLFFFMRISGKGDDNYVDNAVLKR